MKDKILDSLQLYTLLAICLQFVIINLPDLLSNGLKLELIENKTNFLILVIALISLLIYRLLIERYSTILQLIFKKPMLKYTNAKKKYNKVNTDYQNKPFKSYDHLPPEVQTKIDKLDELAIKEYIPKFFDLIIAQLNSIILLAFCIHMWDAVLIIQYGYLFIGLVIVVYFSYLTVSSYNDIEYTITNDYMSLFEE